MNAHRTQPTASAQADPQANKAAPAPAEPPAPSATSSTPQPVSQAERSVMHPEWHDPEWRYYHGAWGG